VHEPTGEDEGGVRGERDVRQRRGKASTTRISLSHGVAERKRLTIYERELTKLDVHQEEGRVECLSDWAQKRGGGERIPHYPAQLY
jgi:hypothetical protein